MISSNIYSKFLRASLPSLFSQGACDDARVLEEPRKSRKSRGSGGLENAFSARKDERERKGEEEEKTASEEDRMEEKNGWKGWILARVSLAEIK